MRLERNGTAFTLSLGGRVLIRHSPDDPFLFAGHGEPDVRMRNAYFSITDFVSERVALRDVSARQTDEGWELCCAAPGGPSLTVSVIGDGDRVQLKFVLCSGVNRIWLRLYGEAGEHFWGGGEQFSYLDLSGRRFPFWVSEPGVGRDDKSFVSFQARRDGRAGEYWNTYYPQPTVISSRDIGLHLDSTAYSAFDFRRARPEIECWEVPHAIEFFTAESRTALVSAISARFGRPPALPAWTDQGAIIGLKDGANSFTRLERIVEAGVPVCGLWCEDWAGVQKTSFGTRLFWNWEWDADRYPGLPEQIASLDARGIRFLAYANPYLNNRGGLFERARQQGFLVRDGSGEAYDVDFGGFNGGMVDFTNPDAVRWYIDTILRANMLDLGVSGWMADFGEFLPADARLHQGDPLLLHNAWPALWAELNARAIAEAGRTGDALFFMRSGFTGIQPHCTLLWGGDQLVDFSRHDGLPSAIRAALSSGLMGNPYHHSDIGGYMSLYGARRTPELFMRWAEMAAFTAVMRTHEGNRPSDNVQLDSSPDVLAHFARMVRLFVTLAPYRRALVEEAVAHGLPLQRPLWLHFPDDPIALATEDAFLLGPDLLVAPVQRGDAREWSAPLPAGTDWVHVWSGTTFHGGQSVTVRAPLGQAPVFFRAGSAHQRVFQSLPAIVG